jgi:DHA1 family multidrug/chloramphenicol efflux transport protein-like MFS transporter
MSHDDSTQYDYTSRQARLFVFFLLIYEISTYVANDMIMPGMLNVIHHFHANESFVSASLTVFILGGASLQIFLGPLSDCFGRRPVMLVGVIFFLISTIFISISFSMASFMWGRFFQGMGLCYIVVIGYASLHELYEELYAVRLISIMNIITILAPLAGPMLGVVILNLFFSWRVIFILIALFATVALVGLYFYMPETLNKIKKDGTHVPLTLLKCDVVKNNYYSLLKNKSFMFGAISLGMGGVPLIAWIGVSPLILMKGSHLSAFSYAMWQIPIFMASTFGTLLMRYLTRFMPLRRLIRVGALFMLLSAIITCLLSFLVNKRHYIAIVFGISCFGFSWGLTSGGLTRLTLYSTSVPKGTASALMNLILMIIIALGNQIAGRLYTNHNNLNFSLFCALIGIIYVILYYFFNKNFVYFSEKK